MKPVLGLALVAGLIGTAPAIAQQGASAPTPPAATTVARTETAGRFGLELGQANQGQVGNVEQSQSSAPTQPTISGPAVTQAQGPSTPVAQTPESRRNPPAQDIKRDRRAPSNP